MKTTLLFSTLFISVISFGQQVADMISPRYGHTATGLPNGNVVVLGGGGNGSTWQDGEIWDAENDSWDETDLMAAPRISHQANLLPSGNILVSGGWNGDGTNHDDTEIYDTEFDSWEAGPDMSIGRSNHRSIVLNSGDVLITGGYDGNADLVECDLFDSENNTITATGDMNTPRSSHTLIVLPDGKVLAAGGFNPDLGFQLAECEIYDPTTGEWTEIDPMSETRDNHAAGLFDGKVIISGGRFYNSETNSFEGLTSYEVYDPVSNAWSGPYESGYSYSYHQILSFAGGEMMAPNLFIPSGTSASGNGVDLAYDGASGYVGSEGQEFAAGLWNDTFDGSYRYAAAMIGSNSGFVCGGIDDEQCAYHLEATVGIEEPKTIEMQVSPNPTAEFIQVDADLRGQYEIQTIFGQKAQSGMLNGPNQLDCSALRSGVYVLTVRQEGKIFRTTFEKL